MASHLTLIQPHSLVSQESRDLRAAGQTHLVAHQIQQKTELENLKETKDLFLYNWSPRGLVKEQVVQIKYRKKNVQMHKDPFSQVAQSSIAEETQLEAWPSFSSPQTLYQNTAALKARLDMAGVQGLSHQRVQFCHQHRLSCRHVFDQKSIQRVLVCTWDFNIGVWGWGWGWHCIVKVCQRSHCVIVTLPPFSSTLELL